MDKLFIIKVGGNIIDDEEKLFPFLEKFAALEEKKILIHGGGKMATNLAAQLNVPQEMVEGRRITNAETLKVVTMVYAGLINKTVVSKLQSHSCNAIGLTGADADLILANKRERAELDYGFAGDVQKVNHKILQTFLNHELCPVIAPITHNGQGQLLNTNADTIAKELAIALSNNYQTELIYLFEKAGVLSDAEDETSVVQKINKDEYKKMKNKGFVSGGMIPKLDNAFAAIQSGVQKVVIGKADDLTLLVDNKAGTILMNE